VPGRRQGHVEAESLACPEPRASMWWRRASWRPGSVRLVQPSTSA